MRVLATYAGTVRDFRAWLAAQRANVVSLAGYREKKKTAKKRPTGKKNNIVSLIIPKGTA